MKTILIATDFSVTSGNAVAYGVSLSRSFDADAHILNVVWPPVMTDDSMLASVMVTQAEIVAESDKMMEEQVKAVSATGFKKVKGYVQEGYTAKMILKFAETIDADLIVMGIKGKGKSNSVFGSTTTTIIEKSIYPVCVIPEDATFEPVNNITLASDLDSKINMDCYKILKSIAGKFRSKINILHVEKKASAMDREAVVGMIETSMDLSDHDYEFQSILESDVIAGISRFVDENPTDMLAMASRRHSFFEKLFGRMQTRKMSYETKIPLLVLQDK